MLKRVGKPSIIEKIFRLIFKNRPTFLTVCINCSEPYPKNMSDYEGRKQYIETQDLKFKYK